MSDDLNEDPWRRADSGPHRDPVAVADPEGPATSEGLLSPYTGHLASDDDLAAAGGPIPDGTPRVTDDLAAELAAHAPRRLWNRATVYLGAAFLVVGGFIGGVQVQKNYGTVATPASTGRPNFSGANGANAGGYFGGGGQTGSGTGGTSTSAAAATTGKVKLVDGTTVYVETSTGDVVTVKTGAQTKVTTSTTTPLKGLAAGDPVTVQGSTASDGTVTATSVTKSK